MSTRLWSFALQWSRVGIAAALFLVATRFLSLAEIGLFATAIAPVRLTQGLHKAGIGESVIVLGKSQRRCDALFGLSLGSGLALALALACIGAALNAPLLIALSTIPFFNGVGAVSEGLLRRRLALRTLALRTIAVQTLAALIAFWLLYNGMGPWALAGFALANAALSCGLSIWLAQWRPTGVPSFAHQNIILPKVAQITVRDMLTNAQFPLAQLAIGLTMGMAAAGAFQIATRMLNLIEALTLSPLRFIALPQLRTAHALRPALQKQMSLNAMLAAWIWGGTIAAAPLILRLATGDQNAVETVPILRALALMGLLGALLMPLLQALTATGQLKLVLEHSAITLALSITLVTPTLLFTPTLGAAALSTASLLSMLWVLPRALRALELNTSNLSPMIGPLVASTTMTSALLLAPPLSLMLQVVTGTAIYGAMIALMRAKEWNSDVNRRGKTAPRSNRNAV